MNATSHLAIFNQTSSASATNAWYNSTTSIYSGSVTTLVDGASRSGDFTQIRTPSPIVLSNFTIQTLSGIQSSCPNTFVFAASTNGTTWTQIASASNLTWTSNETKTFTTLPVLASYFRLIVSVVGNSGTSFRTEQRIVELRMFENVNLRDGETSVSNEIITLDKTIFKRPFTLSLTSPTGVNLSAMSNWSCELAVSASE